MKRPNNYPKAANDDLAWSYSASTVEDLLGIDGQDFAFRTRKVAFEVLQVVQLLKSLAKKKTLPFPLTVTHTGGDKVLDFQIPERLGSRLRCQRLPLLILNTLTLFKMAG